MLHHYRFLPATQLLSQVSKKASGPLKITAVKTYIHPTACFVKIETDAGISGWGEADHDHTAIVAKAIRDVGTKYLLGEDPFDSEYLWNTIFIWVKI